MTVTAKVSEIDYKSGYVKVILTDRDNMVSDWIPMLSNEYHMPKVGDIVTCDFTDETCHSGFCKGKYFNQQNKPLKSGEDIYYKEILDELYIEFNNKTKQMTITVQKIKLVCEDIKIKGNISIKGNLLVDGDIHSNGNIKASGLVTSSEPKKELEGV